jgi:hypothetical protein
VDVGDIFIVDENLRHRELRYGGHAALLLQIHCATETACPIECIEETDDHVTAHSFFDTLKASAAPKELLQSVTMLVHVLAMEMRKHIPQALVIVDDLVVS